MDKKVIEEVKSVRLENDENYKYLLDELAFHSDKVNYFKEEIKKYEDNI